MTTLDAVLSGALPDGRAAVVGGHGLGGGILPAQAATGDPGIAAVVLAGSAPAVPGSPSPADRPRREEPA